MRGERRRGVELSSLYQGVDVKGKSSRGVERCNQQQSAEQMAKISDETNLRNIEEVACAGRSGRVGRQDLPRSEGCRDGIERDEFVLRQPSRDRLLI